VEESETLFAEVPVGFPDGAESRKSTYEHLLVTYPERTVLIRVVGAGTASEVIDFWARDHYRWIYQTMVDRHKEIGAVVARHGLQP
jgi:hypothetical protein